VTEHLASVQHVLAALREQRAHDQRAEAEPLGVLADLVGADPDPGAAALDRAARPRYRPGGEIL
jgi:hypothetical protein